MNKSTWRNTSCVNKNIIAPNIFSLNMTLLVGDKKSISGPIQVFSKKNSFVQIKTRKYIKTSY